jgi:hypothetical protein
MRIRHAAFPALKTLEEYQAATVVHFSTPKLAHSSAPLDTRPRSVSEPPQLLQLALWYSCW